MVIDIPTIDLLILVGFGLFGGIVRVLLGYAKAYEQGFQPRRAWFTLLVAALSGALAAVLIADDPKIAVIAGLGGSDIIEALWKGLAKRTAGGVYATSSGVLPIWITQRQMKGVDYARRKGKITTKEYAKTVDVSLRTAERDMSDLVKAGYLQIKGQGRGAYYVLVKKK